MMVWLVKIQPVIVPENNVLVTSCSSIQIQIQSELREKFM